MLSQAGAVWKSIAAVGCLSGFLKSARGYREIYLILKGNDQMQGRIPAGASDMSWFHNIPYANFRWIDWRRSADMTPHRPRPIARLRRYVATALGASIID
jgi:hypothetical protein